MILTCQNCQTSFRLEEALLKPSGSKVRCSLCKHIWLAQPPKISETADADVGRTPIFDAQALQARVTPSTKQATPASAPPEAEIRPEPKRPPELKLFSDEELDDRGLVEEDDLVTDEINLDELDLLLRDDAPTPAAGMPEGDFKTEELNLADLEKMLDQEQEAVAPARAEEPPPVSEPSQAAEPKEDSVIEELDLDLEDLENLLADDADLGGGLGEAPKARRAAGAPDKTPVAEEIKLDMGDDLDALLAPDSREPAVEETEDFGLDDFLRDEASPETEKSDAEDNLGLELAPGLEDLFDDEPSQDVPLEETEELDFSALGADLERSAATDEAKRPADAPELDLDFPAETEAPADELDLAGLDEALEESSAPDRDGRAAEAEPLLELDLEGSAAPSGDLEDLELELDADASGAAGAGEADETRELELDELEALLEDKQAAPRAAAESPAEGLELDLDLDDLDEDSAAMDDATRELDLNDIEKILEMEAPAAGAQAAEAVAEDDLELDLDLDAVAPAPAAEDADARETTDDSGELDLSELEKMLDVEDTTDAPAEAEANLDELDLDFELQPAATDEEAMDLEFDMLADEAEAPSALFDTSESEDLGLDLGTGAAAAPAGGEEDLDFEILTDDIQIEAVELEGMEDRPAAGYGAAAVDVAALGPAGSPASRDLTQELMDEMAAADTQTMEAPPVEAKPIKPAPRLPKKRKSSRALVWLFVLALLGGGGYYAFLQGWIDLAKMPEIPYISQWLGRKAPEAVVPVEASLKGSWIQNQKDGRLYAIQGLVQNDYAQPRSFVRVTGRVYADGRKFQRAANAYCGNVLSAQDLETLPLADIQTRLSNRNGEGDVNVNIAPGKKVPFMVVFGGLPPEVELQEFAVEISGSLPAGASK